MQRRQVTCGGFFTGFGVVDPSRAAGVNEGRFVGLVAPQQRAVLLKGGNRNGQVMQHRGDSKFVQTLDNYWFIQKKSEHLHFLESLAHVPSRLPCPVF